MRYDATPAEARAPTQVGSVFGAQGDPDWTNNSVTSSATAALTEGDAADGGSSGCRVHARHGGVPAGTLVIAIAILFALRRRRA